MVAEPTGALRIPTESNETRQHRHTRITSHRSHLTTRQTNRREPPRKCKDREAKPHPFEQQKPKDRTETEKTTEQWQRETRKRKWQRETRKRRRLSLRRRHRARTRRRTPEQDSNRFWGTLRESFSDGHSYQNFFFSCE